jgi:hypothetical protein
VDQNRQSARAKRDRERAKQQKREAKAARKIERKKDGEVTTTEATPIDGDPQVPEDAAAGSETGIAGPTEPG